MEIDRDKGIKLIIVAIATLAALAVTSTIVQLITTILPFLIVGAGVFAGYRWVLSDTAAPTADEVEEQARGLFSRFRKTKSAVETTMKVGAAFSNLQGKSDKKEKKKNDDVVHGEVVKKAEPAAEAQTADETEEVLNDIKQSVESSPEGKIEFKDRDVVISEDDLVQADTSRLEEKEKEVPEVNDNVLSQIEERRRRLEQGRDS
jgi:hypothetical protein